MVIKCFSKDENNLEVGISISVFVTKIMIFIQSCYDNFRTIISYIVLLLSLPPYLRFFFLLVLINKKEKNYVKNCQHGSFVTVENAFLI